jgi:hypothetical protein
MNPDPIRIQSGSTTLIETP